MKAAIRKLIRRAGFDVVRVARGVGFPSDVDGRDRAIIEEASRYSMTSVERLLATIQATRHVVRRRIPGAIVECGVWRGGSMVAAARALIEEGDTSRSLYLYDTFEGMTEPSDVDRAAGGNSAKEHLDRTPKGTGSWCYAPIDDVRANLGRTGYPDERVNLVKGPVEETIPAHSPPGPIALLRLDTDWYESTRHELEHLFPLLQPGGILIIDDYGHWEGARKAADEFIAAQETPYFLHRIDYTGRLLVK